MAKAKKEALTSDNRGDREGLFNEKPVDMPVKKPETRLYVSAHQKQGFKVPVRDMDGKIIMQTKPGTNMPVIILGKPVPALRDCNFLTQSHNIKRGCLSYYETSDSEEISVLEALSADPSTEIKTEEMYLKAKDPIKYDMQKTIEAKDEAIDNLSSENVRKDSVIADLEAQIKKITGEA